MGQDTSAIVILFHLPIFSLGSFWENYVGWDILENLEERILTLYGDDIIEMIKSRHFIDVCFTDDSDEDDTHLIEDDIPF